MSGDRTALHRLRIRRGVIERRLRLYYREAEMPFELDDIVLAGLYCDHRVGLRSTLTNMACEIHDLDREIETIQGERSWPTWNVYKMLMDSRVKRGDFSEAEESDNAAAFLAEIDEQLTSIPHPLSEITNPTTAFPLGSSKSTVFLCYSHRDCKWLDRICVHLRPLEREGILQVWSDRRIRPGETGRSEIATAIDKARVAILLVSADFLASDFIADHELPPLILRAKHDGAVLLPIILSACRFQESALGEIQAVNSPGIPVNSLPEHEQETLFLQLSRAVAECLRT
jgi:hypothetical protein